jgi:hypothetical protein
MLQFQTGCFWILAFEITFVLEIQTAFGTFLTEPWRRSDPGLRLGDASGGFPSVSS